MDAHTIQDAKELAVRQRITLMVNRYEVRLTADDGGGDSGEGPMVALAQQKRMAFKEQVTFYEDEDRTRPLFSFKARKRIDLSATYDVTDSEGKEVGAFRKNFAESLFRSTWHVQQPGLPEVTGRERNVAVAIVRRLWNLLPYVEALPFAWPYHFDFVAADGTPVMSVVMKLGLRDVYRVQIHAPALDRRLAVAMAVGLDALQSR